LNINTLFDKQFINKAKPSKKGKKDQMEKNYNYDDGAMQEEDEDETQKSTMTYPIIYMYENGYSRGEIINAVRNGADINLIDPCSN
jgi:hypothetical protein